MLFPGIVLFVIFVSFLKCVTSSIIRHKRRVWENLESWIFLIYFLIGVKLLYNVVCVSAVQGGELAICVHTCPPSWASSRPLIPLEHWDPCAGQHLPTDSSTHGSVHMSVLLSQFTSLESCVMVIHVLLPCLWLSKY